MSEATQQLEFDNPREC